MSSTSTAAASRRLYASRRSLSSASVPRRSTTTTFFLPKYAPTFTTKTTTTSAFAFSTASSASQWDESSFQQPPRWNEHHDGSRFWKRLNGVSANKDDNDNTPQPFSRMGPRYQRPIFVAATRQHVGKTTVSLALMSGLQKRFSKVGFIKPVGQQHVPVRSESLNDTIRVDKDVCLVKEHFALDHLDYQDMSPVIIPAGYTRRFVDGEVSFSKQVEDVDQAMSMVADASDVVLCEGTGHVAVGSVVGINNAKIAALVGADVVLVANGGLGSAFDELELNRILCQHYNVRVAGVVINKVIPEKYDQTKYYLEKACRQAWGVPLLGCIPDRPFLGCPALADLEALFKTQLLSGTEHRFQHYNVNDINVVVTNLTRFLENMRQKPARTLYITHVTREDLIMGFLGEYQRCKAEGAAAQPFEAALLICGRKGKYQLSKEVKDIILRGHNGAPIMAVDMSSREAMAKIHSFTPKLNIHDQNRVSVAIDHYEQYINFDELLRRTQSSNSSFNDPSSISLEDLRRL